MNVTCDLAVANNSLTVRQCGRLVGIVNEGKEQPEIILFSDQNGLLTFTLGDLAIIQDNWNQLQELREAAKKS